MSLASPASRNHTIDIARGLGILLVVLGHNWLVIHDKGELFRVIFSFHLPLFFFLSGIHLREAEPFRKFALGKADALLKPYFVILLILSASKTGAGKMPATRYFEGMLYSTGPTIAWEPLWFLPHLFVALLFSWAMLRAAKWFKAGAGALGLASVLLLALGSVYVGRLWRRVDWSWVQSMQTAFAGPDNPAAVVGLPFSADLIPISSAFILLGYLLRAQVKTMRFALLPFLSAAAVFFSLHYFFNDTIDLNMRVYDSPLIASLQALTGIYLALALSALMSRSLRAARVVGHIGSCSLFILMFHSFAQVNLFYRLERFNETTYANAALAFAAGVLFPICLQWLVQRWRPAASLMLPFKAARISGAVPPGTAPKG